MTHDGQDEQDLEQLLVEMRRSYNVPPEPPLDAMWEQVGQRRWAGHGTGPAGRSAGGKRGRTMWWLGMAAALVLGVAVGRFTNASRPGASSPGASSTETPATVASRELSAESYDRTTTRYLGQTAALLVALPAEVRAGRPDRRFVARAAELLTTTRLLLDSPAAADPKVRALLEDLELVLAQVAHLEPDRGRIELELIAQALEQRDLLPRLTSAVAGSAGADD